MDRFRTRRRSATRIIFSAERVLATRRFLLIAAAPLADPLADSPARRTRRAASNSSTWTRDQYTEGADPTATLTAPASSAPVRPERADVVDAEARADRGDGDAG